MKMHYPGPNYQPSYYQIEQKCQNQNPGDSNSNSDHYSHSLPAYNWASAPTPYGVPGQNQYQSQCVQVPASQPTSYYSSEQPAAPTSSAYYVPEQANPGRQDLQSSYEYSSLNSNPAYTNSTFQPTPAANSNPGYQYSNPNPHSSEPPLYSSRISSQYAPSAPSLESSYAPYHGGYDSATSNFAKSDGHFDENKDNYGLNYSGYEQRYYEQPRDNSCSYGTMDSFNVDAGGFGGEEVYAYDAGKSERCGSRLTGSQYAAAEFDDYGNLKSSKPGTSTFDDYGNLKSSMTASSTFYDYGNLRSSNTASSTFDDYGGSTKIAKVIPKAEAQDSNPGVQKFRVKLLPDQGNQSAMDVLFQVGLDCIRMFDPNTNRTLRIYSLEHVTKWEVTDPEIFSFWSKSSVDIESKCIRVQSNRYTTSTILDTVAAACVQFQEMVDNRPSGYNDARTAQPVEKKSPLADWMRLRKPAEEKDHWVPDEAVSKCTSCGADFGAFVRRHHCRNCGHIFCDKCTQGRISLTPDKDAQPVRVCDRCLAEVTHRLANSKEASNKSAAPQRSHDDIAKRLMEEMDKNRTGNPESGKSLSSSFSSRSNSDGGSKRTKEVACPTCTVHLQVQVPISGTETVECGVCQHPFLVSA